MNPSKNEPLKMIKTQKEATKQFLRELIYLTELQEQIIKEKKMPWENEK